MRSDLIVMGAGLLSLAVISAPIWLAPILARWPKNEHQKPPCDWWEG